MPRKTNTRAAQGDGSIRQRPDGLWEGRYTLGADPGTGKQRRKSVYAPTQAECRKKLREATEAVANGTYFEPAKITVAEWFNLWLAEYLGSVKHATAISYGQHVKNHVLPNIGAVKLADLRAPMIQRIYNNLQRQGISPKTIKNLHGCIHKALEVAVRNDYIARNPADVCTLPRIEKSEIQPLDAPDIKKLLEALNGHKHEVLIKTAMFTGMRIGELIGLTWDCVDFENGVICVKKQLLRPRVKGEGYTYGTLKNDKPRTITPANAVMDMLRAHKRRQAQQRLLAGSAWDDGEFPGLVFTNELGGHLCHNHISKQLDKALEAAGIPKHRFHDLRHTYAVNSLRAGDDIKTVQENLGHHTAAFTLDMYAHSTETMKRESAKRMDAFIAGLSKL